MAYDVRIVVLGATRAAMRIEAMGARATNIRPALEEIYLTILDIVDETFDSEGARGGFARWARLKISTVVYKAKKRLDPRILRATGELYTSMTSFRHPDQYVRIERYKIIFAPKSIKGKVALTGTRDGRVPARPFVRFTEQDQAAFAREILRHIARGK